MGKKERKDVGEAYLVVVVVVVGVDWLTRRHVTCGSSCLSLQGDSSVHWCVGYVTTRQLPHSFRSIFQINISEKDRVRSLNDENEFHNGQKLSKVCKGHSISPFKKILRASWEKICRVFFLKKKKQMTPVVKENF